MATYTVAALLSRAAIILQDTTSVRWPQNELLGWLNDGQREITRIKPNANVRTVAVQLAAGVTQQLPADAVSLIDITRNLGANGATPGRAVRRVDRRILDAQVPDWASMTPTSQTLHYCYTPLDIKVFYVYPPQPTPAGYVEMQYLSSPADIVDPNSTITLDDIYAAPLLDYILYRAYLKDADYTQDTTRAEAHLTAFTNALQQKVSAEATQDGVSRQGGK